MSKNIKQFKENLKLLIITYFNTVGPKITKVVLKYIKESIVCTFLPALKYDI